MSAGLVVCSKCRREVHQDGPRDQAAGSRSWRHCEDKTARCDGATSEHATPEQVQGVACFADDYRMPL